MTPGPLRAGTGGYTERDRRHWAGESPKPQNAKAGSYGLTVGLIWWPIGMIFALGYFTFLFRTFKGKVAVDEPH